MPLAAALSLMPGAHVWIALDGATLSDAANVIKPSGDATSYTAAGRTAKPSDDDTAWVKLGIIKQGSIDPGNGDVVEVEEPMPGALHVVDRFRVGAKPKLSVTVAQLQPITLQLLLHTATLNGSSSVANPLALNRQVYAWVGLQVYGNDDVNRFNIDVFCELSISGAMSLNPKAMLEAEFEANVLYSPLNVLGF